MRPFPRADLVVAGAAGMIFLLTVLTMPEIPCTVAAPCRPEPVTALAVGVLAAVAVMSFVHRWAAVVAAVVCSVLWPVSDRVDESGLGWRGWLPLVLLAVTVAVARLRWPAASVAASRRQRPPASPRLPRFTRHVAVGVLLLVCGIAVSGWTLWRQDRVAAQEAAARIAIAVVRQHLDDGAVIGLELSDGTLWHTEVVAADDYPVGSRAEILVDDAGLRQLRSEPYDLTMLLLPAVAAAGLGVAYLVRVASWRRALRRFLAGPQAVRPVRAMVRGAEVIVVVPGPGGDAEQFAVPVAGEAEDEASGGTGMGSAVRTEPALLYGMVQPGQWCAVQIGARTYVAAEPIAYVEAVPYDGQRGLPADIDDDGEPSVEEADLLPADRDLTGPREYRLSSPRAWRRVVATGMAGAAGLVTLTGGFWPVAAVAGVVGAVAGTERGWRLHLRPRLRWSLGGVHAVTPWRSHRMSWTPDSGLDIDETGDVQVTDGQAEFIVPVRAGASHDQWQLVAALRHARRLALDNRVSQQPPSLAQPRRPWQLHLVWSGLCVAAIALSSLM